MFLPLNAGLTPETPPCSWFISWPITATLDDGPQIHLQSRPPPWAPDSYFQEPPTCSTWMSRNRFTLCKSQMEFGPSSFWTLIMFYSLFFDLLSHLKPVLHRHVQTALLFPVLEGANSGACVCVCVCLCVCALCVCVHCVCVCIWMLAICPPWVLFLHFFTVTSSWLAPHPFLFYGTLVSPSFWKCRSRDWSCISAAPQGLTDLGHLYAEFTGLFPFCMSGINLDPTPIGSKGLEF